MTKSGSCEPHQTNDHQTCVRCGLVLGLEFSDLPIRSTIGEVEEKTTADLSTGAKLRYADGGLGGTLPNFTPTNETGVALRRVERLRGEGWRERRLSEVLRELDKTAERLGLPRTVQEEISYLFRKCQQKGLTRGHDTSLTVGALVYIVCRYRHISRSPKEIYGGEAGKLLREVRRLTEALDLRLPIKTNLDLAKEYLPRFATKLGVGDEVVRRGLEILNSNGHQKGKNPAVLAGAVLYGLTGRYKGIGIMVVAERLGVGASNLSRTANTLKLD